MAGQENTSVVPLARPRCPRLSADCFGGQNLGALEGSLAFGIWHFPFPLFFGVNLTAEWLRPLYGGLHKASCLATLEISSTFSRSPFRLLVSSSPVLWSSGPLVLSSGELQP